MDAMLEETDGDISLVYDSLTPGDISALDTELKRVSGNDPVSMRYYLENYHLINTKGENEPPRLQTLSPFKESQEIIWQDFIYCIDNKIPVWWILLKARQVGWSTLIQAMIFYRTIFNPNMTSLVIADERVRSGWIFDMSRLAYDYLPYWMRPEMQYEVKGDHVKFDRKDSEERRRNPGLRSTLYCDAANKPSGSSRGMTLHCLHASEISRYNNPRIISSDIIPTVPRNNPLTIACLEGTAEGRNYFYKDMWESAMSGRSKRWRPLFTAWWQEKTYFLMFRDEAEKAAFIPNEEERTLISKIQDEYNYPLSMEQLNWRRDLGQFFEDTEKDFDKVEQEYPSFPESAFRISGLCFFPKKRLMIIEKRDVRKPIWQGELKAIKRDGKEIKQFVRFVDPEEAYLWVWEFPKTGDIYYLGADPGHGVEGKDYSAISIWRIPKHPLEPYSQVAEVQGFINPTEFSKLIAMLGEYYNNCEVSPECNTITTVITDLLHVHEYPQIYRWRRHDKTKGKFTNYFGWETNRKSRNYMMDRFRSLMLQDKIIIKSRRLIDECYSFVDDDTGRFESSEDTNDDCLFSAMICVTCMLDFDPTLVAPLSINQEGEDSDSSKPKGEHHNTDYSLFDEEEMMDNSEFSRL